MAFSRDAPNPIDTFSEPTDTYTRAADDISLEEVRTQIRDLEEGHRSSGIELSGRILHVVHLLPITAAWPSPSGVPSPPPTPKGDAAEAAVETPAGWTLAPRYGHSAMISGVRSLSTTHENVIVGWTGDILSATTGDKIPVESVEQKNRDGLDDALRSYTPREADPDDDRKSTYVPVWLEDKVAHGHYDGYCKATLWPLFHYLLWQDVASQYESADDSWSDYVKVNEAFAKRVAEVYRPGDLIWVHDYHLLLVPKLIRQIIPDAIIGLFVHTPFPSSEVFRCLPRRQEILGGMVGANLICFQTYSYLRHFTSTCVRVSGYEVSPRGIDADGHVAATMHCPVGVDAERVARDILRPGIQPKLEALKALYEGKKIIVGRDKLDVVKGVLQKLRAFEKLLTDYPQWVGNVVLIQVTSPSLGDSPKLERQVSELVSHINGEFGSLDFIPVHHYHQTLKKDEFYALLSVADLGVITPLRDGMNTTSIEFVIAQDKTKKSPSVLSEFMGISKHMEETIQVNPWDLGGVAAAMHRGLTMPEDEKAARHDRLHKTVTTHTSHTWAAVLVKMLLEQINHRATAKATARLDNEVVSKSYANAKKRLFCFDYDGTLTPIVKTPSMAVPSKDALEALSKLTADPKNIIYIISGRDQEFLELHFGKFQNLGMSAEHGAFIKEPGEKTWTCFTDSLDMDWMGEALEIFKYYTERTTGSHIELKKSSITWHYRGSDPEWGQFQCRQCQDLLENNLVHKRPIEVLVGKKNLEVRPIAINKGEIVKRIVYNNPDVDFIFCAGDDKTDEDMFRALILFKPDETKALLDPPVSLTLLKGGADLKPVELLVEQQSVFTTTVGHSAKRTLASSHVNTPEEVVKLALQLVNPSGKASL